eukprot:SAG31_NODE_2758_length_5132_cov_298.156672_2_plen_104_part_00
MSTHSVSTRCHTWLRRFVGRALGVLRLDGLNEMLPQLQEEIKESELMLAHRNDLLASKLADAGELQSILAGLGSFGNRNSRGDLRTIILFSCVQRWTQENNIM